MLGYEEAATSENGMLTVSWTKQLVHQREIADWTKLL